MYHIPAVEVWYTHLFHQKQQSIYFSYSFSNHLTSCLAQISCALSAAIKCMHEVHGSVLAGPEWRAIIFTLGCSVPLQGECQAQQQTCQASMEDDQDVGGF